MQTQHKRSYFHADICWSFCPSWLTTAKQTRWHPATSPSCWDPTCCGPRLRGEWWLNTKEGCYCNLCLVYTLAHSPSHFNPPQESGWDGSSYFCACCGHRGAHNPTCWLVLSWGWALGLLFICPSLVDSHDFTTDKCCLIKRCCQPGPHLHTTRLLTFYFGKSSPLNLAEVDFNVSGMFAMPAPTSNHNNHVDYDCGTIERKRPQSMVGTDSDVARKDK